jgi:hypothetical protein
MLKTITAGIVALVATMFGSHWAHAPATPIQTTSVHAESNLPITRATAGLPSQSTALATGLAAEPARTDKDSTAAPRSTIGDAHVASIASGIRPPGNSVAPDGNTTKARTTTPNTFVESSLGFSFVVPLGFSVQRDLNDEGETILVLAPDGTNTFQVYITSFNDGGKPFTAQRIEQEAGMAVANDSPITLGGVQGIQFDSTADTPPTRQVWFVYQGFLYQAETYATNVALLQQILASWRFTQQ